MKRDYKTLGLFSSISQLALYVLIPIVLMLFAGLLLDRLAAERAWAIAERVSFTAVCVIVGILAGARNFWQWCRSMTEQNRAEEGRRGFGDAENDNKNKGKTSGDGHCREIGNNLK